MIWKLFIKTWCLLCLYHVKHLIRLPFTRLSPTKTQTISGCEQLSPLWLCIPHWFPWFSLVDCYFHHHLHINKNTNVSYIILGPSHNVYLWFPAIDLQLGVWQWTFYIELLRASIWYSIKVLAKFYDSIKSSVNLLVTKENERNPRRLIYSTWKVINLKLKYDIF